MKKHLWLILGLLALIALLVWRVGFSGYLDPGTQLEVPGMSMSSEPARADLEPAESAHPALNPAPQGFGEVTVPLPGGPAGSMENSLAGARSVEEYMRPPALDEEGEVVLPTGTICGHVFDPSGQVVPGARVRILAAQRADGELVRRVSSSTCNEVGYFEADVPAGSYSLQAYEADKTHETPGILYTAWAEVALDQRVSVDLILKSGFKIIGHIGIRGWDNLLLMMELLDPSGQVVLGRTQCDTKGDPALVPQKIGNLFTNVQSGPYLLRIYADAREILSLIIPLQVESEDLQLGALVVDVEDFSRGG